MFVCTECGAEYNQWEGKCRACGTWETIRKFKSAGKTRRPGRSAREQVPAIPFPLADVPEADEQGLVTGITDIDTVFGGQLTRGAC